MRLISRNIGTTWGSQILLLFLIFLDLLVVIHLVGSIIKLDHICIICTAKKKPTTSANQRGKRSFEISSAFYVSRFDVMHKDTI